MFRPIANSIAVRLVSCVVRRIEDAIDDADSVWDGFCDGDDELLARMARR